MEEECAQSGGRPREAGSALDWRAVAVVEECESGRLFGLGLEDGGGGGRLWEDGDERCTLRDLTETFENIHQAVKKCAFPDHICT